MTAVAVTTATMPGHFSAVSFGKTPAATFPIRSRSRDRNHGSDLSFLRTQQAHGFDKWELIPAPFKDRQYGRNPGQGVFFSVLSDSFRHRHALPNAGEHSCRPADGLYLCNSRTCVMAGSQPAIHDRSLADVQPAADKDTSRLPELLR